MNQEIEMSVCCIAFNQAKYIRETIEGILSQKTSFGFEVLITDDASTDETAKIIQDYESRYPDVIKGIYHKNNQYSLGKHVFLEQFGKSKGKYITTCECDDYWVDENKLQKQYDIMKSHQNVALCTHTVRHIEEDGALKKIIQPSFLHEGEIAGDVFIGMMLTRKEQSIFHYSSYCFRKEDIRGIVENTPDFLIKAPVGDIFIQLYLGTCGSIYYIDEEMSHYRRNSVGSWTIANNSKEKKISHWLRMIDAYKLYDEYTRHKFHSQIQYYVENIRFEMLLLKNDFRGIRSNKERYAKISRIKKIRVFLCCYFPFTERLYMTFKNRGK